MRSENDSDPGPCVHISLITNYSQRAVTLVIIMFPLGIENQAALLSRSIKTVYVCKCGSVIFRVACSVFPYFKITVRYYEGMININYYFGLIRK